VASLFSWLFSSSFLLVKKEERKVVARVPRFLSPLPL